MSEEDYVFKRDVLSSFKKIADGLTKIAELMEEQNDILLFEPDLKEVDLSQGYECCGCGEKDD